MKKILLLILVLSSFSSKAQTWVYHEFPDSAAVWNFHFMASCIGSGSSNETYSIMISGDTSISGQTYQKLFIPYIDSSTTGVCYGNGWYYRGAVREDVAAKKVYHVMTASTTPQLLYDFNMQVGDTVQGYMETFLSPHDTIVAIDSVLVGTTYRKRWELSTYYNVYFIEGIGSTYGLLQRSPGYMTDNADYTLTCFSQEGATLYPNPTSACEVITSVNSIPKETETINIYPNPSNGSFTIDLNKTKNIREIGLSDMLGKKVLDQKINTETSVQINSISNGTYILTLITDNGNTINKKVIVLRE